MLNWLSNGVVNIAGYVANTLFFIDVLIWFLLVRKNTNIRENKKIMIKTGVISMIGAAIAPLLIVIVSGNLFPFLSGSWKVLQKINSFAAFKTVISIMFIVNLLLRSNSSSLLWCAAPKQRFENL